MTESMLDKVERLLREGLDHYGADEVGAAINCWEQVLELDPGNVEAVDYMKNHTADLVVLDMIMEPGIDGLDTYKRILEVHPDQKAIIASGYSETERVKEAQRLGATAYIKKPYLLEKIGKVIRTELDN